VILLDTNVISEALRIQPDENVVRWLDLHFSEAAISSVTVLELAAGVVMLASGRRRDALELAIQRTIRRFGPRVFAFDTASAMAAAQLFARARSQGRGPHQVPQKLADLQIAGTALAHGLQLATRNVGDFEGLDLDLIDPWQG
jgi:predicted nucleic acid-binding protein